jgi:outer membrane protein
MPVLRFISMMYQTTHFHDDGAVAPDYHESTFPMNTFRSSMIIAFAALILFGSRPALAQPYREYSYVSAVPEAAFGDSVRMNLRQCLDRAMSSSLDIRESELKLVSAEVDKFQADMSRWLPVFEVRMFTSVVKDAKGSLLDTVSTSWGNIGPYLQITGEVAQPITTFGRISSLRQAAGFGVQAQTAGVAVKRAKVADEVYRLYHGVLLARKMLDILNDASQKLETARNRVRELLHERSTQVTTTDLAKLDVYGYELERKRLNAEKSIRLALGALRRTMGIPYTVPFNIEDGRLEFVRRDLAPLDSLQALSLRRRPEIDQVEAGVQARYYQYKAERARRYPEVFIGMDWNFEQAPGRNFESPNPFISDGYNSQSVRAALGARWQLGLYDRESDIQRAHVAYQEMLRKRAWARQSIVLEVHRAYEEASEAEQSAKLGRRSLRAGRAWLLQTIERYDLGVASTRDLLEAYGAYSKSQADYYKTLYDHYLALAELYRTIGRPIWEIAEGNGR